MSNILKTIDSIWKDEEEEDYFLEVSRQTGIDPDLLRRVRQAESGGDPKAISPKGARGPFQFMEATGNQYGLSSDNDFADFHDPKKSTLAAGSYLRDLMKRYKDDPASALAAYNWGMGNLDKHGLENAPEETRNYISKILDKPFDQVAGGAQPPEMSKQAQVDELLALWASEDQAGGPLAAHVAGRPADSFLDMLRADSGSRRPSSPVVDRALERDPDLLKRFRKNTEGWGEFEDPGHLSGLFTGFALGWVGIPELAAMGTDAIRGTDTAAQFVEKRITRPLEEARVNFLAAAEGAKREDMIRIPGWVTGAALDPRLRKLGKGRDFYVSMPEFGRLIESGTAEVADLIVQGVVGLGKVVVPQAAKLFRATGLLKQVGKADEAVDAAHTGAKALLDAKMGTDADMMARVDQYVAWPTEYAEVETTQGFWKSLVERGRSQFFEKYSKLIDYGVDRRQFGALRGSTHAGESGVLREVGYLDKNLDYHRLGPSLREVFSNAGKRANVGKGHAADMEVLRDADIYLSFDRLIEDIVPRNKELQRQIIAAKKAGAPAEKIAKLESKVIKGVTKESEDDAQEVLSYLMRKYGYGDKPEQWQAFAGMVQGTRDWMANVGLMSLRSVNVIDDGQIADLLKSGQRYAPWHKIDEGISIVGPEGALAELKAAEASQLAEISLKRAGSVGQKPLVKLTQAIGKGEQQIISPVQAMIVRAERLSQYVDGQRVRNAVGEALETHQADLFGKEWNMLKVTPGAAKTTNLGKMRMRDDTFSYWKLENEPARPGWLTPELEDALSRGKITAAQAVERALAGVGINRNIPADKLTRRAAKNLGDHGGRSGGHAEAVDKAVTEGVAELDSFFRGGKAQEYLVTVGDKEAVRAMRHLNSGQAHLLSKMIAMPGLKQAHGLTKLFRGGVVLGQEFIIRNPIRDQLMASVMSKFGYIPGWNFAIGLGHVLGKTARYNEFHAQRAGTASFITQDMTQMHATLDDLVRPMSTAERRFKMRRTLSSPVRDLAPDAAQSSRRFDGGLTPAQQKQTLEAIRSTSPASAAVESVRRSMRNAFLQERAGLDEGLFKQLGRMGRNSFRGVFHGLQNTAQLFEESTRVGAFARAARRYEKGVGFTRIPAFDMAIGGVPGYMKMAAKLATGGLYKGFSFKEAAKRYRGLRTTVDKGGLVRRVDLMDEGRDIILDYRRAGYTGEIMNGFYAFANAELQDVSKFARAMKETPVNTAIKGFTFMTIPAMANWYLNFDDPRYMLQSDTEKALFYHPFGYTSKFGKYFRIPKPIGTVQALFGTAVTAFMDNLAWTDPAALEKLEDIVWPGRNQKDLREGRNDLLKRLGRWRVFQDFLLDERKKVGGDPDAMRRLREEVSDFSLLRYPQSGFAPTALSGVIDVLRNWDSFFDTQPTPRRFLDQNAPLPEDVKLTSTTPIEESLASLIRQIPVWNLDQTQAIQVRHLLTKTFGSIGQHVIQGVDQIGQGTGLFEDRPGVPMDITKQPLIRAFWGRPIYGSGSDPVEDFYRLLEESSQARQSLFGRLLSADQAGGKVVLEDHPEWKMAQLMSKMALQINTINRVYRQVQQDKNMDDVVRADKLMQLDQTKTIVADAAVKIYRFMTDKQDWQRKGEEAISFGDK